MNNLSAAKIKEQIEKQKQDLATWEKALKDQEEVEKNYSLIERINFQIDNDEENHFFYEGPIILKELEIVGTFVEMTTNYNDGKDYFKKVYRFEPLGLFVEFSGYYSSYYGDTFDPKKTRIVTPKQVVKTVYE